MELTTISQLRQSLGISTRTLRYYEEIGLVSSIRPEGYAYRAYDQEAVARLRQILVLRKLGVPLKKIEAFFSRPEQERLRTLLEETAAQVEEEINALSALRNLLGRFLSRLAGERRRGLPVELLSEEEITALLAPFPFSKNHQEELTMEDLSRTQEALSKLKNVRILYLPPCTVAAAHYIGPDPEDHAGAMLDAFVDAVKLPEKKPDFRVLGFNNPSPQGNEEYGYEFWVTIPEDMETPLPVEKKRFPGGLYAVHCIKMGDFWEWGELGKWVENSLEYEYDTREPFGMGGCLEEHLNAYTYYSAAPENRNFSQLDLMMPVKPKNS